jgi:hypothetical protein
MVDRHDRLWQTWPLTRWLAVAGFAALGFSLVFSWLVIDRASPIDVQANVNNLIAYYLAGFTVLWAVLTVVAVFLRRREDQAVTSGHGLAALIILSVAILARVIVLMATSPILSDDMWRYLHDGATLSEHRNPYDRSPAKVPVRLGTPALFKLKATPHADLVTIYQPLSQWIFRGGYNAYVALFDYNSNWDPIGDRSMRCIFIAFDLLIILLLLRRLRQEQRSLWWAVLYAWHPLAISEVAGSGHQDVIGMTMIVGALMFADPKRASQGRGLLAGAALAGAIAVKPLAAPLGVVFAWTLRRKISAVLSGFMGTVLALAAAYIPFIIWEPGLDGMLNTVRRFVGAWEFNSSIHAVLTHSWWQGMGALMAKPNADTLMVISLGVIVLVCLAKRFDAWRTAMVFFFAGLLLSTTAHPWYLLWALVLLPLRFNWALWVWSLTISWSYLVLRDAQAWDLPVWVGTIEYLPVYLILLASAVIAVKKEKEPLRNTDQ